MYVISGLKIAIFHAQNLSLRLVLLHTASAEMPRNERKSPKTDFFCFLHAGSNPLQQSGLRVSKTDGFLAIFA